MRTIVDLPDEQVSALAEVCRIQGISRAEAVRRAIAEMLANQKALSREETFGAWNGKRRDSQALVRKLREEWD